MHRRRTKKVGGVFFPFSVHSHMHTYDRGAHTAVHFSYFLRRSWESGLKIVCLQVCVKSGWSFMRDQ